MNVEEMPLEGLDDDQRRLVAALRALPQRRVAPGFAARVMAEIGARRRRGRFSVAAGFAAAASLVALLAVGSIFTGRVPKPTYAAWVTMPNAVRLQPYRPADWYRPVVSEACGPAAWVDEPLCTRSALVRLVGAEAAGHGGAF